MEISHKALMEFELTLPLSDICSIFNNNNNLRACYDF